MINLGFFFAIAGSTSVMICALYAESHAPIVSVVNTTTSTVTLSWKVSFSPASQKIE